MEDNRNHATIVYHDERFMVLYEYTYEPRREGFIYVRMNGRIIDFKGESGNRNALAFVSASNPMASEAMIRFIETDTEF